MAEGGSGWAAAADLAGAGVQLYGMRQSHKEWKEEQKEKKKKERRENILAGIDSILGAAQYYASVNAAAKMLNTQADLLSSLHGGNISLGGGG